MTDRSNHKTNAGSELIFNYNDAKDAPASANQDSSVDQQVDLEIILLGPGKSTREKLKSKYHSRRKTDSVPNLEKDVDNSFVNNNYKTVKESLVGAKTKSNPKGESKSDEIESPPSNGDGLTDMSLTTKTSRTSISSAKVLEDMESRYQSGGTDGEEDYYVDYMDYF